MAFPAATTAKCASLRLLLKSAVLFAAILLVKNWSFHTDYGCPGSPPFIQSVQDRSGHTVHFFRSSLFIVFICAGPGVELTNVNRDPVRKYRVERELPVRICLPIVCMESHEDHEVGRPGHGDFGHFCS